MKKHFVKILSIVISSMFLLSGCGSEKTKAPSSTETTEQATDDKAKTSKISILTAMAYGTEELDKVIESFKANNPGVEVDIQHVPNGNEQALSSRVNSGDVPDIFLSQTGSAVASYYEYAYDFTNDPIVSKFKESAIEISKNSDGKLLSLPWTYESMAFIVNKKIMDEAGITEMPKTIKELDEICQKIEAKGYDAFASGLKETWVLSHIGSHFIAGENENPQDTIKQLNDGTLTFQNMKHFNGTFDVLDLMIKYGPEKPMEVDWELSENKLSNAQAGIIHMGDWCEATLVKFNPDVEVAFMPVPIGNDGANPTFLSSISWQLVLHKDSKNLEKAKELMEYMLTSEEGIAWMTKGVRAVPAAKTDALPEGMLANSAVEYINSGKSLAWNHVLWPNGFNPRFGATMQSYLIGEMDREEVLKTLDNEWQMAK